MKRLRNALITLLVLVGLGIFVVRQISRSHGRFQGALYRLFGLHPDPNVNDLTLADRVRSELGPVEKRLDLPHVHVMAKDHVVLLHGDVEWPHEAATIEKAVRRVAGVRDVESHLHLGLLRGDTRPSAGRRHDGHTASAAAQPQW